MPDNQNSVAFDPNAPYQSASAPTTAPASASTTAPTPTAASTTPAPASIPGAPNGLPGVPSAVPAELAPAAFDPNAPYQPVQKSLSDRYSDAAENLSNTIEDTADDAVLGAGKAAAKTAYGAARLANNVIRTAIPRLIPGVKQQLDKWVPEMGKVDDYVKAVTGDPNATLEEQGLAQNIGGIGETIAEFMVGEGELKALGWVDKAGEVSKAAKLLKQYPRLARIITNAMRAGAIASSQDVLKGAANADDPASQQRLADALKAGGFAALGTSILEGGASLLKPVAIRAFDALNLPGEAKAAAENLERLQTHNQNFINGLESDAAAMLKRGGLKGQELVGALQDDLDSVYENLTSNYGSKLNEFAQRAEQAGIQVGGPDSPLAKTAQEILGQGSKLPAGIQDALQGVTPSLDRAKELLEHLAKGEPMSWAEATELQKTLGAKAFSITDYADPLKRVLNSLKSAVGESFEQAAAEANQPELANDLKALRADYHDTISQLQDNSIIRAIRNKDLDGVAKVMMSRDTIGDNVTTLRNLLNRIGSKNMVGVENEMFEQLMNKAADFSSGKRVVDFDKFAGNFFKIPEEVRTQIWGNQLDKFGDVIKDLQKLTSDGEFDFNALKEKLAESRETASKLLYGGIRHGGSGVLFAKALWDIANGDTNKALKDLGGAALFEGGTFALKQPALQKAILSTLEFLSHASETGIKVTSDEPVDAASLVARAQRGATPFGTGPQISGMAGSAVEDAQQGLPASTTVKPSFSTEVRPGIVDGGGTVVAKAGDKVIGSVDFAPSTDTVKGGTAHIQNLEVEPQFRRQHAATRMYETLFDHAREAGYSKLTSGSVMTKDAEALWKSLQEHSPYTITEDASAKAGTEAKRFTVDLGSYKDSEDITDELNQHVAEANAAEPPPKNPAAQPAPQQARQPLGARYSQALKDAQTTGTPIQRRVINDFIVHNDLDRNPGKILDVDAEGPTMMKVVEGLRRAYLADLVKDNPEMAKAMADALNSLSSKTTVGSLSGVSSEAPTHVLENGKITPLK